MIQITHVSLDLETIYYLFVYRKADHMLYMYANMRGLLSLMKNEWIYDI